MIKGIGKGIGILSVHIKPYEIPSPVIRQSLGYQIVVLIVKTLVFGDPTSGWPSMICILCLISGVQLFCMGIIGQYLSKAYMEVKERPIYICREEL